MSNEPAAPVTATPTDEIFAIAEVLGDIKTRFERVETEHSTQRATMEAAATALNAALTGLKTLQHHVLDNSIGALGLRVEEQRKAIDEQLTTVVAELQRADKELSAKTDNAAAQLRSEFAQLVSQLKTQNSELKTECERIQLEAKREIEKLALVPGPMGPAGASMSPMGTWAPGKYPRLAVVSLMGSSYLSQVDDNEEKPTPKAKKWQVLAQRGSAGGGVPDLTSIGGVLTIAQGGTGATTKAAAATAIGVGTGDSPEFTGVTLSGATASKLLQTDASKAAASVTLSGLTLSSGTLSVDAATTSAAGKVELATDAETVTGTDATRGVTPAGLTARLAAPGAIGGTTPAVGTFTTVKLGGTSGPDIASSINARGPRQGFVSNGGAGVYSSFSLATTQSGDPLSIALSFDVPSAAPTGSNRSFFSLGNQGTEENFLNFVLKTDGSLEIRLLGTPSSNQNIATIAAFVSNYAGKRVLIVLARSSAGNPAIYINGVAQTPTFSTAGTPPTWQGEITSTAAGGRLGTTIGSSFETVFTLFYPYNRALTAAEVLSLYETGTPSGTDYNASTGTATYTSDFSAGDDSWAGVGGRSTVAGNQDGVTDGTTSYDNVLYIQQDSTNGGSVSRHASRTISAALGKRFRLSGKYYIPAGQTDINGVTIKFGSTATAFVTSTTTGAWTTFSTEVLTTAAETTLAVFPTKGGNTDYVASNSTEKVYIRDFVFMPLGLLLSPDTQEPGVGYQWHDQSGNGANILLPSSGVAWALPTSQPTKLRGATVHAGAGNIQLLGAACIPIGHHITAVRAKASTGTPTVYIGNASGDNSYVQAVALSTSWKVLTVVAATAITTTTAVWVNSDAAATISLDISHEPVSA